MAVEDQVLKHLKTTGSANTYRLARELDVDRERLLDNIKKLEERGVVEVRHGIVGIVQFPTSSVGKGLAVASSRLGTVTDEDSAEKKPAGVTAAVEPLVSELLSEPQISESKKIVENARLKRKTTRLSNISNTLQKENEALKEKMAGLQSQVKKLQRQAALPPKVITRTVVKKVKVFTPPPAPKPGKFSTPSKQAKSPTFHLLKNLQALKIPAFAKK